MALRLGQARGEDVADLIARKQYAKAIEIIKAQLGSDRNDPRIRLQLADVLVMAGRPPEAVAVLIPLADEYARDGFAAKAVAVLKRIQKIDPKRRDIESRLASLIEEKQRLAIARALLRRPHLLVFDEATSSLDSLTEEEISQTIRAVTGSHEVMAILIAHRLSTIMHADRIHVLERGRIIEQGRHAELLEQKGLYYAMWRQQAGERRTDQAALPPAPALATATR